MGVGVLEQDCFFDWAKPLGRGPPGSIPDEDRARLGSEEAERTAGFHGRKAAVSLLRPGVVLGRLLHTVPEISSPDIQFPTAVMMKQQIYLARFVPLWAVLTPLTRT